METGEKIYQFVLQAQQNAYAPYSRFPVGACIETVEGQWYCGCNVENASYGLSVCAETNALGQMIAAGYRHIKTIAIIADSLAFCPPCGACRQRLMEFSTSETRVYLFNKKGSQRSLSMIDLFPFPFDKTFLENL